MEAVTLIPESMLSSLATDRVTVYFVEPPLLVPSVSISLTVPSNVLLSMASMVRVALWPSLILRISSSSTLISMFMVSSGATVKTVARYSLYVLSLASVLSEEALAFEADAVLSVLPAEDAAVEPDEDVPALALPAEPVLPLVTLAVPLEEPVPLAEPVLLTDPVLLPAPLEFPPAEPELPAEAVVPLVPVEFALFKLSFPV